MRLRNAAPEPEGPGILYLTPTRALANDLQKRLSPPLEQLGLRLGLQTKVHRLVATLGVIGIGAALGAILDSQDVDGWIIGFAVSVETLLLTALVWSAGEREGG